jgi:hypothetical protein
MRVLCLSAVQPELALQVSCARQDCHLARDRRACMLAVLRTRIAFVLAMLVCLSCLCARVLAMLVLAMLVCASRHARVVAMLVCLPCSRTRLAGLPALFSPCSKLPVLPHQLVRTSVHLLSFFFCFRLSSFFFLFSFFFFQFFCSFLRFPFFGCFVFSSFFFSFFFAFHLFTVQKPESPPPPSPKVPTKSAVPSSTARRPCQATKNPKNPTTHSHLSHPITRTRQFSPVFLTCVCVLYSGLVEQCAFSLPFRSCSMCVGHHRVCAYCVCTPA